MTQSKWFASEITIWFVCIRYEKKFDCEWNIPSIFIDLCIKHLETNMNGNGYILLLLLITGLKALFKRSSAEANGMPKLYCDTYNTTMTERR